jgi:hypothetical protein
LKPISNEATNQRINETMSKSIAKSRTTYNPFTHPKFAKTQKQEIIISIEVMPPLNLEELRALYDAAIRRQPLQEGGEWRDQTAWKCALGAEINRCTPKPEYMRRKLEHPAHPTQHSRIDPTSQNQEQLISVLRPETLRRTFISITALMKQIHEDISEHLNH